MEAAGAVVTGDAADYELIGGIPAKHMGYVCAYRERLKKLHICPKCSRKYRMNAGVLQED